MDYFSGAGSPEQFNQFLITTDFNTSDQPLETLETNFFGISHSELGAAYLKEWWPVSEKVVEAVESHGGVGLTKDQTPDFTHVISTANQIANKYGLGHSLETSHESVDESYLDILNMSREEMDELVDWTQVGLLAAESVL